MIKGGKIGTATVRQITPLIAVGQKPVPALPSTTKSRKAGYGATTPAEKKSKGPQRRDREGDEQTILIAEFALRYPAYGELLIHIPNGGYRKNAFEGYRLRAQGVRKGVSDLYLPVACGGFFGLWIEFKAAPPYASQVSDSQKEWIEKMLKKGYYATVAQGPDAALGILATYLSLPPTVARIDQAAKAAFALD